MSECGADKGFLAFLRECHAIPLADFGIRCSQLFEILSSNFCMWEMCVLASSTCSRES